ncbi:MAG: putative ABC transporter ATP-binding protein YknY [Elusimicrobia bacterium]|nr:putative ABC transporter ATP-binding protein YknY [Elusimicrobiota bacterium]
MTTLAFDLKNVVKRYRVGEGEMEILHALNLQIPVGQYVAIVGPSGSGKSTLMQLLGCLDVPSEGTIQVMGHDTSQLSDDDISALRSRSLGFVFQAFHLLQSYDARSNVGLAMVYSGRQDRSQRAEELLKKFGLGHRLHHRPKMMSGGEQQRVAIARALANNPPVILADEPTGALDQANGRAIMDVFETLHTQGKTIVLITHDPTLAERAERVIEMVDGSIGRDRVLR